MSSNNNKNGKISTSTIYDVSLRPMRWLLILFGVVPPLDRTAVSTSTSTPPRTAHCCIVAMKCVHMLTICGGILFFSYMHFQMDGKVNSPVDAFSRALYWFGKITLLVTHFIIQLEGTWKHHQYQRVCAQLEATRLQLAVQLGKRMNLDEIKRRCCVLYTTMVILNLLVIASLLAVFCNDLLKKNLIFSVYSEMVMKLKFFEFTLFTLLVVVMLEEIYAAAKTFVEALMWSRVATVEIMAQLNVFQELHAQLWLIVQQITQYFEWCLPGLMLKIIIDVILTVYWTYMSAIDELHIVIEVYCLVFMFYYLIVLCIICSLCSKCEALDKKFRRIFQTISIDRRNRHWNMGLRSLVLQLTHETIYFRQIGDFRFNRNFIGVFFLTVVSYSVILIQIRMENDED